MRVSFAVFFVVFFLLNYQVKAKVSVEKSNDDFKQKTVVSIKGNKFFINGKPTFKGREWEGKTVERLLLNFPMVQGIFDEGYRSVPVNLKISSERKLSFFQKTKAIFID